VGKFPQSQFINDALELGILQAEIGQDTTNLKKYARAQFDYETANYTDGIKIIQELMVKSGNIAEYGYLLLSRLFTAQNEFNQAIATLNEFSKKFPSSSLAPKARYELGLIYLESVHDTLMAKNAFEDLISNSPQSPESYFARSWLTIIESNSKQKQPSVPK
jgi:tetratricopeptide (TPR) repeat protein